MQWFDDTQLERHRRAPNLIPYFVCRVEVKGFEFIFHSVEQIQVCLDYYRKRIYASGRLPVYSQNLGGDHNETQRWFDRLPQYLLENSYREKVLDALDRALVRYIETPGATTGVAVKPYTETW